MCRYSDPQPQVGENDSYLFKHIFHSQCLRFKQLIKQILTLQPPVPHIFGFSFFISTLKQHDRPYDILAMPFNFNLSSSHLYYRNTQCFFMEMPINMFLVMYVILCILSHDFNKLTMLYIHVHISLLFL